VDVLFLMLAVLLALAALVVAVMADVRTRRATRELARELVHLREHIRTLSEPTHGPLAHSGGETAAHELAEVLRPRMERLERRLADALENPEGLPVGDPHFEGEPGAEGNREHRILVALRRQGYCGTVILDTLGNGSMRIEAERDGMTFKGVATIDDDGVLDLAAVSSARAFP
jgi:hypothetical protein